MTIKKHIPDTPLMSIPKDVIALNLLGVIKATNLGRNSIYNMLEAGVLRSRKFRSRRIFLVDELKEDLKALELSTGDTAFDANHKQAS